MRVDLHDQLLLRLAVHRLRIIARPVQLVADRQGAHPRQRPNGSLRVARAQVGQRPRLGAGADAGRACVQHDRPRALQLLLHILHQLWRDLHQLRQLRVARAVLHGLQLQLQRAVLLHVFQRGLNGVGVSAAHLHILDELREGRLPLALNSLDHQGGKKGKNGGEEEYEVEERPRE